MIITAPDPIRDPLLALPELRAWPEAEALIRRTARSRWPCWELPLLSCAAVGAPRERAHHAASAVFAMYLGIHLVDDLLDDDANGLFRRIGPGATANLALALQAAALRVIAEANLDETQRSAAARSLATMAMATARGQQLDTMPLASEADYWRVVDAKTPPLFASALELGALCAGAPSELATQVGSLGQAFGRMLQVSDDLEDAMKRPAAPDWKRPGNNLAILYASTAPHTERERFVALRDQIGHGEEDAPLAEAQSVLLRSGAVAYCTFHIIHRYRLAIREIEALELANPAPLVELFRAHVAPSIDLLRSAGVTRPERFLDGPVRLPGGMSDIEAG